MCGLLDLQLAVASPDIPLGVPAMDRRACQLCASFLPFFEGGEPANGCREFGAGHDGVSGFSVASEKLVDASDLECASNGPVPVPVLGRAATEVGDPLMDPARKKKRGLLGSARVGVHVYDGDRDALTDGVHSEAGIDFSRLEAG